MICSPYCMTYSQLYWRWRDCSQLHGFIESWAWMVTVLSKRCCTTVDWVPHKLTLVVFFCAEFWCGILKEYGNNCSSFQNIFAILPVALPYFINVPTCQSHICDSYPRLPDYRFVFRQLVRSPVHGSQDNWVLPIILMHCMWWGRGWFCLCPSCKIAQINIRTTRVIMKMLRVLLHDDTSSKCTKERVCLKRKEWWTD